MSITQYYFAYGSNMNSGYLSKHRRIRPKSSRYAYATGYRVLFARAGWPLPILSKVEPAFALMVASAGSVARGVLHELTPQDLRRISRSEGPQYSWQDIDVETASGERVRSRSLVGLQKADHAPPSRRYMNLLLNGAEENHLPQAYIDHLRKTETVYYRGLSEAAELLIQTTVRIRCHLP